LQRNRLLVQGVNSSLTNVGTAPGGFAVGTQEITPVSMGALCYIRT
jgi:hypothetical protein